MNIVCCVLMICRVMIKRAQGRKRFGRKNFKQRYFRLTTEDLTYSRTKGMCFIMWQNCVTTRGWLFLHCAVPVCLMLPGKEPLCCIPLDQILAVERLQEDSFKMKNMFQIVQPERALYIQVCELISVVCSCAISILTQWCLNKTVWQHFSVQCCPDAWQRVAVAWRSPHITRLSWWEQF